MNNFKKIIVAVAVLLIVTLSVFGYFKIKKNITRFVASQTKERLEYGLERDKELLRNLANSYFKSAYSEFRRNGLNFDLEIENLKKAQNLEGQDLSRIEKICRFQVEESTGSLYTAKGYDCLSRLQALKTEPTEIYRSIKNSSYSLDVYYLAEHAETLWNSISSGNVGIPLAKGENYLKYFSGYSKDEVPFLNKLIELNIPSLSAKSYYRLAMINIAGRSSSLEEAKPDLKKAVEYLNKTIELSGIKATNKLDVVFAINDKYAAHSSVSIASALVNADLDSFYDFYFIMDPQDPISKESQKKLSSMRNIRDYGIKFVNVDNSVIPVDSIKKKKLYFPLVITYRPFLSEILLDLDYALSLDADILVLRDLNYFKTLDMKDYFVAGTYDCADPVQDRYACKHCIKNFYINAGVMWFNLDSMRKHKANEILTKSLNESLCDFALPEQDLINVSFYNEIFHISQRWNNPPIASEYFEYLGFIIHYYGQKKPWDKEEAERNELDNKYWIYRELTPWN